MSTDTRPRFTRGDILKFRAKRRKQFAIRSSLQGLAAKARLCLQGKGANGASMSQDLIDRHLDAR